MWQYCLIANLFYFEDYKWNLLSSDQLHRKWVVDDWSIIQWAVIFRGRMHKNPCPCKSLHSFLTLMFICDRSVCKLWLWLIQIHARDWFQRFFALPSEVAVLFVKSWIGIWAGALLLDRASIWICCSTRITACICAEPYKQPKLCRSAALNFAVKPSIAFQNSLLEWWPDDRQGSKLGPKLELCCL